MSAEPSLRPSGLSLPFPPSANRLWRSVPGRGVIKSAPYRQWLSEALALIMVQRARPVRGAFHVRILAHRPDRRARDLDNLCKPTLDVLAAAGVIENDSLAKSISLFWSDLEPAKPGSLSVTVDQA